MKIYLPILSVFKKPDPESSDRARYFNFANEPFANITFIKLFYQVFSVTRSSFFIIRNINVADIRDVTTRSV